MEIKVTWLNDSSTPKLLGQAQETWEPDFSVDNDICLGPSFLTEKSFCRSQTRDISGSAASCRSNGKSAIIFKNQPLGVLLHFGAENPVPLLTEMGAPPADDNQKKKINKALLMFAHKLNWVVCRYVLRVCAFSVYSIYLYIYVEHIKKKNTNLHYICTHTYTLKKKKKK